MKLEDILNMIEEDSPIQHDALERESLNIPRLHAKYLRIFAEEKRILNQLKSKLTVLLHEKMEYYSGKAPAEVYKEKPFHLKLLKSDIEKYVEADSDVVRIAGGIDQQEEKIHIVQEFIKSINQRSYNIRNAIEYLRWTQGGN